VADIGESDLGILLRDMRPMLHAEPYTFCVVADTASLPQDLPIFSLIREAEGTTVIAAEAEATRAHLSGEGQWARITLIIHSALSAVGLTAAVSAALAAVGISANIIAGYYHDHIFVPWDKRHLALTALQQLAASQNR